MRVEPHETTGVAFTLNGQAFTADVEPRRTLSDVIREDAELTGTHLGCEHGVCGACTVLVDGQPARSCLMLAVQADGADITTIEGLAAPTARSTRSSRPCTMPTGSSARSARRAS